MMNGSGYPRSTFNNTIPLSFFPRSKSLTRYTDQQDLDIDTDWMDFV
jgi:hypothetical protein